MAHSVLSIGVKYSVHDLLVTVTMPDLLSSNMRHIR